MTHKLNDNYMGFKLYDNYMTKMCNTLGHIVRLSDRLLVMKFKNVESVLNFCVSMLDCRGDVVSLKSYVKKLTVNPNYSIVYSYEKDCRESGIVDRIEKYHFIDKFHVGDNGHESFQCVDLQDLMVAFFDVGKCLIENFKKYEIEIMLNFVCNKQNKAFKTKNALFNRKSQSSKRRHLNKCLRKFKKLLVEIDYISISYKKAA